MSLKRQFLVVLVAFALALAAAGGWLSWSITSRALEAELDEKLILVAGGAAEVGLPSTMVEPLGPGDEESAFYQPVRRRLLRLQRFVDEAYIFQRNNTVLVSTEPPDSLPIGARLPWLAGFQAELDRAWMLGQATTPVFEGADGRYYKYGFVRLEQSDFMLAVRMPADFLEPLERYRRNLLLVTLGATLLAALLAWSLARNISRPLERLARVALRIQRGRLSRPVTTERGDELGRLSRAMERMRQGILQRDEQLRLMLAQVAHEIRNPLGGLELFASAAAESDEPEERSLLLLRIRREVEDLNRIINDFLAFARPLQPERELHDVRDPVREAGELSGVGLGSEEEVLSMVLPDEPLLAYADPDHVKRVVLNLLKNAGQAGDRVRLEATSRRGEVMISIRDDGPGVPRELRERIFEPFVTEKEQGAGLGLAIVKRVVEANEGRVELVPREEAVGEGAEFRVYFPGSEDFAP